MEPPGRQALHRRVEQRLARLDARRRAVASRSSSKCKELGIKNIHVHKGPTIWPLDKDAFDPKDVDIAATDNPELNFIIEHVGLPRIEDFCFMATQEPNVYAGLSVVIGGLMYARPRFFAKVMGELLFWVGEDKMLFGSDYGIWEPKWQIEGFLDWDYPSPTRGVLGLPAAQRRRQAQDPRAQRRQAVRHRGPRGHRASRTPRPRTTRSWSKPDEHPASAGPEAEPTPHSASAAGSGGRRGAARAGPRRARARSTTPSSTSRSPAAVRHLVRGERRRATSRSCCGCRRRSARPTSRS